MSYHNSNKIYLKKRKMEKERQTEIENKLNKYIRDKFQYFFPDTKRDICEFIEGQVYPEEELNIYYELARQSKFDLIKLIIQWAKKIEDIIYNEISKLKDKADYI